MTAYNDQLFKLRREAHLTQADVASKLGVDQSAISRIETGQQSATVDQLISMCQLYGATVTIERVRVPPINAGAYVNMVPKD